ncbi:MAG: thiamine pyrophosphate-binding protein [Gammaproteobacteria bacterium]
MSATAASRLVNTLAAHGVDRVFCVPGVSYLNVLDALRDSGIHTVPPVRKAAPRCWRKRTVK